MFFVLDKTQTTSYTIYSFNRKAIHDK